MVRGSKTTSAGGEKEPSTARKRKPTDGDENSVDEDLGEREEIGRDEGDEQSLTTGIDEQVSSPSSLELNTSLMCSFFQSLKAAVWYTVAQIAQEEEIELGRSMSEPFVASLTELVYAQAENLALELKAFADHAGRTTIREEDVKLVCRKSTVLQEMLDEEARRFNSAGSASTKKTAATVPATKNAASKPFKKPKPKPTKVGCLPAASSSRNPLD
ncbi:hypothetical protein PtA15_1A124 [Puccinia triticina]|uniref:Centromere protein S n=1 Tax=Puccinia triticina TaxID=208348 RepID=A0ABY7C9F8_9BASI|nr:uncharacterized protein PtA15_1A124 [Puccinia triticina]WAQ80786.1 hypothetical protein PtA15_1A124 [Puccinia triticina]WAR51679.1 hypothetical protein PtB15_1B115 [Puccinia triticina]